MCFYIICELLYSYTASSPSQFTIHSAQGDRLMSFVNCFTVVIADKAKE